MPTSVEYLPIDMDKFDKEVLENIDKGLNDIADIILTRAIEELKSVAFDRGTLAKSGSVNEEFMVKTIGFGTDYAAAIEFGRKAHWIPIEPLKGWARRHGLDEQVAYAIQKVLSEKDQPPKPFLRVGMEEGIRRWPEIMRKYQVG
jgi:hypothetical protein